MTDDEIQMCIAALYENSIDGRIADAHGGSDFDRAERELCASFEVWLRESA